MVCNLRDFDFLTKPEEHQYSHIIERENARKIVRRHLRNESYDEFLARKEQESCRLAEQ